MANFLTVEDPCSLPQGIFNWRLKPVPIVLIFATCYNELLSEDAWGYVSLATFRRCFGENLLSLAEGFRVGAVDRLRKESDMKRIVTLVTMILVFCFSALPVFSESITTKPKGYNEWAMHNDGGALVGTLKRTEKGNFKFYDQSGGYVGLIVENGKWIPRDARRSYTSITSEEAQLYLDSLKAIETLNLRKVPGSYE